MRIMPIPENHQQQLDTLRASAVSLRATMTAAQNSHRQSGGHDNRRDRFLQFLWTHSTVPDINTPQSSDRLDTNPSDRQATLRGVFASQINRRLNFRWKCDEMLMPFDESQYEDGEPIPDGTRYVIVVQTSIDGIVYEYSTVYDSDGVVSTTEWETV